mmetsp:Transcript_85810/g.246280  ORF Transcript_85810/g.246280 Transcript_85810/m.246280 type:complete len:240 (-) Transcript_85810:391-1110(-)
MAVAPSLAAVAVGVETPEVLGDLQAVSAVQAAGAAVVEALQGVRRSSPDGGPATQQALDAKIRARRRREIDFVYVEAQADAIDNISVPTFVPCFQGQSEWYHSLPDAYPNHARLHLSWRTVFRPQEAVHGRAPRGPREAAPDVEVAQGEAPRGAALEVHGAHWAAVRELGAQARDVGGEGVPLSHVWDTAPAAQRGGAPEHAQHRLRRCRGRHRFSFPTIAARAEKMQAAFAGKKRSPI